jgi:AcrR family transcriptional regulator
MDDRAGRPGRKRSEESRLAILAAAAELTAEVGYAGLTIEGIAARSGAGKQTIYRWWASKADVLRALMAEAQIDPAFGERFRENFLQHRRDALGVVVSRAAGRGDLPPGAPPETVIDIVFGTLWYRLLATRRPPDERLAEELVATLTRRPR